MEKSKYWLKNFAESSEEEEQIMLCHNCLSKFGVDFRGCKILYATERDEYCYQYFCPYCGTRHRVVL